MRVSKFSGLVFAVVVMTFTVDAFAAGECKLDYWRSDNGLAPVGVAWGSLGRESITLDAGQSKTFNISHSNEKKKNNGSSYYGSHLRQAKNVGANHVKIRIKGAFGERDDTIEPGKANVYQDDLMKVTCLSSTKKHVDKCFGAAGAGCGVLGNSDFIAGVTDALGGRLSACGPGLNGRNGCLINGGSWEHDECCARDPGGKWCTGPLSESSHNNQCVREWNKAIERLATGLSWWREVDFSRANTTGRVIRPEYCARRGAAVHGDDVQYCCSGRARGFNARIDVSLPNGQRVKAEAQSVAKICE